MRSPNGATTILSGLSGPRPDAQRLEDTATRVIAHTESRWLSPTQHGVGPESIHEAVGTILAQRRRNRSADRRPPPRAESGPSLSTELVPPASRSAHPLRR